MLTIREFLPDLAALLPETAQLLRAANLTVDDAVRQVTLEGSRGLARRNRPDSDVDLTLIVDAALLPVREPDRAQRLRPRLGAMIPWLSLRTRFDLIRVHLALGDGGGARTLMAEARDILTLRPDMGTLVDERDELEARLAAVRGGRAGASTLTMAELRVLPLLTTHLTFREIGERLFVSQNTVKTQSISIYRKLDATSRSEAIDRAVERDPSTRYGEQPGTGEPPDDALCAGH